MSQKANQTQQVPAGEPDLAREAGGLMAVFLTVHRLRKDPQVETPKQEKEELRRIERELRLAGEQLPPAAWLLSFFPDMENQYVEIDLDLRQIPDKICDIWEKRDEWKTAAEDYEKQRGIVAESRKHKGEIDKVTKEKRDQETKKRREFKKKYPLYDNIKNYLNLVDEKINKTRGDLADEERKRKALEEKTRIQRSAQHSLNVNAEGQPTLETKASEESGAGEHVNNVLPMQQDSDRENEILARIEKLQGELNSLAKHKTEFENELERRTRVEVEIEDRKQQLVRSANDLDAKDVEQQKKRERCEDRKVRLEKAVSLWLQACRVHVYCTACQSRKSMRFRHTEASHQAKKFTTKCMECNEKLVVPETLHQGGACSRLTEDVSKSAGESLLDRLWIAEAKALEFLRTLSLEHSKPPASDPRDNVAKIIESLQTTLAKCDEEYKATVESTKKGWRKSAVEIGKAVSIYSDAWQGEIAKIQDSSSTETTPDQGKSKMREVMERWNSYEEQTLDSAHPMVQLVDLNEDMRDWITGKSKFILDDLGKHWDVPRVEHCGLDKLLELATSSETRSRLRLAYRTVDCLDKRINEFELSETHEGIVEDFCERLLKKKNISFSPIFTVETARHENLLEESSRSSLDSPKIRALGYACKKAEQIAFRKLEAELPEELDSISAVARKLHHKLKLDGFNREAKESLRKLGYDKRFFEGLKTSDSNNENLRELLGLLGFLITYVDDEQIGNEVLSLFRLVQKEEISLDNNPLNGGERNVKKLRPYFQESDFQESDGRPPNICLLHFWKVGDDDQEGILFELPYFPYPKELSDGLVGLLADSSLWVRDFRESGADDALATLQQVVKLENEFREQPPEQHRGVLGNAVCRLLHSLLQWRSQVRQQDVVDDLVQEILKRASKKYVIDLRPDSNQYRGLCNQRVEPDDLEHFEIERVPSEVIDKPRFTLCEFGVGERKAKLKAEVPPVKELGSHLEFFVDESVWDSLNSLEGLDLPISCSSAQLQHLYYGKNEQLEQIWKRVQKWYGNADSGRKWVGDQIMLMQSEWHPLFKHLIAERKFTLAADRPDFTDRFRNFFESAFEIVGRGNQDVGAIRDWVIDRFVDPDGVSETPDREVVAVFHLLKGQGPCRLFVHLLNDVGIELKGWSQFKGRKYQELNQQETEQIERKVFQEGTQLGELVLEDLSLDEEGQIKPLVAVSVGPPVPEWSRLIESLNTTSEKGVSCDEITSFLRKDLPSAKIRGDAHMRQAVQTLFRKLTDVLVESDLSDEDEDLVYEAVDAYLKQEMSMELFWPNNKREFGSEWDHWLEIEEDSGGQEFDCRVPGLKDRDSDRPLFRARGNVN